MPTPNMTGDWQFIATLTVDGVKLEDNWDAIEGGDTTSATRTFRAGGQLYAESMPGPPTTADIVLERAYRGSIDGALRTQLANAIGREARVTIVTLGADHRPISGTSETITGVLKEVTRPDFRSESAGVALYKVVVAPHGVWKGT
ncbi:hypothetical protein Q5424_09395 [Conexibacter sp. JD483]|uniref:hypothetical protein n=1 Tax=unclassified Conexibacter TaxID=2627773 RepID=UPI00271E72D3|nr:MULTISPECIES: hypothetical protein [unclassified Conexibacter]MDO8187209.1 hypothetical protein [Conexibacter sp. CPCC 205706]MDO8199306.1 hypothetical protein [Conexibacter sp. CPCC 205762]MDR9369293.1 hypothetical protein [Conexibacter sp. JD483]